MNEAKKAEARAALEAAGWSPFHRGATELWVHAKKFGVWSLESAYAELMKSPVTRGESSGQERSDP